jgi:hypothetical protein
VPGKPGISEGLDDIMMEMSEDLDRLGTKVLPD